VAENDWSRWGVDRERASQFEAAMEKAFEAYESGTPVVILDKNGHMLHGDDTCKTVVELKMPLKILQINDVDQHLFNASDWPERLEAARQVFMEDKFPKKA